MPTTLTDRQRQVLESIHDAVERRGYPPSLRELAAELGVVGTRAIEKHIAALERKGYLKKGEGARALNLPGRPQGRSIPIVGAVAAGRPILAEENIEGRLTLDPSLTRGVDNFLLKVKGDSMKNAGILNGDLVLVRPQPHAESGEIVVALLGEEATVKRLQKKGNDIALLPENPDFEPLMVSPDAAFQLVGKVIGVFRF